MIKGVGVGVGVEAEVELWPTANVLPELLHEVHKSAIRATKMLITSRYLFIDFSPFFLLTLIYGINNMTLNSDHYKYVMYHTIDFEK